MIRLIKLNQRIIAVLTRIFFKTTDKFEPKFHEGEWIVDPNGGILHIEKIDDSRYYFAPNQKVSWEIAECDSKSHLWTIKDAKDGDVLQLGGVTAIFKKFIGNGNCICYCSVCNGEFEIPSQDGDDNIYGCHNAVPATKEQRDTLEKAMADAGYTFNFEKKELKKIEQKPAWSEEDEINRDLVYNALNQVYDMAHNKDLSTWINKRILLCSQQQWKPSEEQMGVIEAVINNRSFQRRHLDSLYEQLKKLRRE